MPGFGAGNGGPGGVVQTTALPVVRGFTVTQHGVQVSRIVHTGRPWVRPVGYVPTGSPGLPLINRNPQNDNTQKNYLKDGPFIAKKFGPSDYRAYAEAVTDQTGAITNYGFFWTSTNGFDWTQYGSNPVFTPGSGSWEFGEFCPSSWNVDPVTGEHFLYHHGGGNSNARQIGLKRSTGNGVPGTWTAANGGLPIIPNGAAGAWNDAGVADFIVQRISASLWIGIAKGYRSSDGKSQLGLYTSTDGATDWAEAPGNPVLPLGSGNDSNSLNGGDLDIDELNRAHLWYPGVDSSGTTQRMLYAYSDLNPTPTLWVRNPSDVFLSKSATAADPDSGEIGDVARGWEDDGIRFWTVMNFNFASYTGDAKGRLEARGIYFNARLAAVQPPEGRSGRFVQVAGDSSRGYINVSSPASAKLLDQTAFTIYSSWRFPPGATSRLWYCESANFNQLVNFGLNGDGNFSTSNGRAMTRYRTPTNTVQFTVASNPLVATRYDDNKRHYSVFRRYSAASWDLLVDGTIIATSVVNPSTDATDPAFLTLLNPHPSDSTNYVLAGYPATFAAGVNQGWGGGVVDRIVTIAGYAMSDAEAAALWNGGLPGGVRPSSGTCRIDTLVGSGGQAGPDIDTSPAARSLVVTNAGMVNITPTFVALAVASAPGVASLVATGFAPTVSVTSNQTVAAGVGALTATGLAPTIAVSGNQNVVAGVGALTATGFAPTAAASNNQTAAAGVGALTATGFAPSVSVGANQNALAGTGAAAATGFAPTIAVSNNQTALAGVGVLSVTGFAPTITVSNNQRVTAGLGALTVAGFAPTIVVTGNQAVTPGTGALSASGFSPTILTSGGVQPGTGAVTATGFAPTAAATNNQVAAAGVGALTITGFAPTVTASNNQTAAAGVGALTATGFAPTILIGTRALAGTGAAVVTGFAPTVALSNNQTVTPGVGALAASGFAPTIAITNLLAVSPGRGVLALLGYAPTIAIVGPNTATEALGATIGAIPKLSGTVSVEPRLTGTIKSYPQ